MTKFKYPKDKSTSDLWQELSLLFYINKKYSKNYIKFVESRFIETPYFASQYAIYYMRKRWIEAESKISESVLSSHDYVKYFFNNSFPSEEIETNPLYEIWYDIMMKKIIPNYKYKKNKKNELNNMIEGIPIHYNNFIKRYFLWGLNVSEVS